MIDLRPFQRDFVRAVESPDIDTVALCGPRALGKTTLAAHILTRAMTPGDLLNQPGREYILGAASLEQARLTYTMIREDLEPTGQYRWIDSTTRLGATHVKSNTKLRAISSNPKTSLGLVGVPILVLDEPGALDLVGGQRLSDSLLTAQGKPGSRLKLVLVGTLAPMATRRGHWWFDLVADGSEDRTHVTLFKGDLETWDKWSTIRKANPLSGVDAGFRRQLLLERDKARGDTRLKARFLSYRLNIPSEDESQTLLDLSDWELSIKRSVPEREGRHILAVDLGAGRAWGAAVSVWPNARVEAIAVAPGIPSIEDQEKRDCVPSGTYQRLVDAGVLLIAKGLRVQPPAQLLGAARERWGTPDVITADRFRIGELRDCVNGSTVVPRVSRWSESSEDIRALRRYAKDGPLAIERGSRALIAASLSVAMVKSDDAGNVRLLKKGTNNTGRDDVAAALVLGAGLLSRKPRQSSGVYHGAA